jgi:hypothetical protein
MTFSPGVKKKAVRYIICASRKQTSPRTNRSPFLWENSRITSPAQEKISPANISRFNRFKPCLRVAIKRIMRTGMISAFVTNPVKKDDWFWRRIQRNPMRK